MTVTKALIPTQRVMPVFKPIHQDAMCLDLYPERRQDYVIFTVRKADETEGNYGPDLRKMVISKHAQFIDIYI
jgi:hypothetical protein